MKLSEVFLKAAEIRLRETGIAAPMGCCIAICEAAGRDSYRGPEFEFFAEWFKPKLCAHPLGLWYWPCDEEHRETRVLSLCFAAAIAKSEGR